MQITGVAEAESDDEEDHDMDIDDIDEALHGDVAPESKRPVIASVQEVPDAEYDRNNREVKQQHPLGSLQGSLLPRQHTSRCHSFFLSTV